MNADNPKTVTVFVPTVTEGTNAEGPSPLSAFIGVHRRFQSFFLIAAVMLLVAACGTAPVMQVDKRYHENLTTQEVDRILDRLIAGG